MIKFRTEWQLWALLSRKTHFRISSITTRSERVIWRGEEIKITLPRQCFSEIHAHSEMHTYKYSLDSDYNLAFLYHFSFTITNIKRIGKHYFNNADSQKYWCICKINKPGFYYASPVKQNAYRLIPTCP